MTHTNLICIGKIINVHGVRGDVVVQSFTQDPAAFFTYIPHTDATGQRLFVCSRKGSSPKGFIVKIEGIDNRTAAETLKGTEIYAPRDVLPPVEDPDEFYHEDLLGLTVRVPDESRKGRIVAVQDHGAGTYLDVQWNDGSRNTVPFLKEAVPTVDLEQGYIVVMPDLLT